MKLNLKLKPQILCFTSILFLTGLYFLLIKNENENQTLEYFLATLLVICSIVSIVFWSNPIKDSQIHKTDRIVARITITCFILYILFYKKNSLKNLCFYLFLIIATAITFYTSHYYSSIEWVSNKHILTHGLAHILGIIGICYAF
jgi:hypothetical protein